MKFVHPEVYLIADTQLVKYGDRQFDDESPSAQLPLDKFLSAVGAPEWTSDAPSDGEKLAEFMGRLCYNSFKPGLNPNVTKVREGNKEYLENIIASSHGSVLEHANVTFVFRNVSRVFCYDEKTEIMTRYGWKLFRDLGHEDLVGTYNRVTGCLEWQKPDKIWDMPYSGDMYHVKNEQIDLCVTPNHRMWIKPFDTQKNRRGEQPYIVATAEDIKGKAVRYQKTAGHTGVDTGKFLAEGLSFDLDNYARFLGYYLSEGHIHERCITISQNPGAISNDIYLTAVSLGLSAKSSPRSKSSPGNIRVYNKALRKHLNICGTNALNKKIPDYVFGWSPRIIRLFLETFVSGDGSRRKNCSHEVIYTISREMADQLQILAILAGWSANIRIDDRVGLKRTIYKKDGSKPLVFYNKNICYIVSIVKKRNMPGVNIHHRSQKQDSYLPYSGRVYCVSVPNELIFVRRNGKPVISHNTHELVRHRVGTAISQESLRYVRLSDLKVWLPNLVLSHPAIAEWMKTTWGACEWGYKQAAALLNLDDEKSFDKKKKWTSALRRMAPIGLATTIGWTVNLRTLRHVIEKRTSRHAEEEIRMVFAEVARLVKERYPNCFADYKVEIVDGIEEYTTDHPKI